ncbi:hypothetical protein OAK20_00190 [Synechococcus sp. AH-551-P21]|nr:hypothetical protein [Synechococcus sp. AH-551-P21]
MTDSGTEVKTEAKKGGFGGGCLKFLLWGGGGLIGLFILLCVVFALREMGLKKGCNEGKAEDCKSLLSEYVGERFDVSSITNEEFRPQFVTRVAEEKKAAEEQAAAEKKAAEEKEAADLKAAEERKKAAEEGKAEARLVTALGEAMKACERSLKAAMKDPDSFKVHNRDFETLRIEYSATNSFGARLRNVIDCKTGKNLR